LNWGSKRKAGGRKTIESRDFLKFCQKYLPALKWKTLNGNFLERSKEAGELRRAYFLVVAVKSLISKM